MKKYRFNTIFALLLSVSVFHSSSLFAENPTNLTASTMQQHHGFHYLDVQINKSPTDEAEYKAIRLDNGMEVLLISDHKANKSLFSVGLPIGSMEDPASQQGLAHYLEHMILMGSKSYPETNSLDGFLTKNGGRNNAYTAPDRTVYYLQVNHNAFDEAVARLADAFAAPLLSETNAKKEINAVNAEMVRAKSNDGHLMLAVNKATANPAHPMTNFAVGNNQTLSDKPDSKLHDELWKFYRTHYSANLMKAVLYSNQPIEKMATLAAQTLGKVENKQHHIPNVDMPLFREEDKSVLIKYKPVQPLKMLAVSFDMPEDKSAFKQKSGEYLAYMFNNTTEGTLADYLVKQGLAVGMSVVYSDDINRNRGDFTFYIRLTEKGLVQQDEVISLLFQQIEQMKQAGVKQSYFDELKESLNQEFKHLRTDKDFSYAANLVSQMLNYPLENIIDQSYVVENMDSKAIQAKLELMTVDNVRIMLVDQNAQTDKISPYFEASYSIAKINAEQKAKWLDFSQTATLKLPAMNPYFTTDFSLNEVDKNRHIPQAIIKENGTEVYAMPSRYFSEEPKASLLAAFGIEPKSNDLKQAISAELLNIMVVLARQQMDFQASVAGLTADVAVSENGLALTAEGYTQHLAQLLQDYVQHFRQLTLTETGLNQAKERYQENLDALEKESAVRQAMSALADFERISYYDVANKRAILAEISLNDLEQLRQKLLTQSTQLRLMSVGNFSDSQIKNLTDSLERMIANNNSSLELGRYIDINESQRKLNYIKSIPHEDNGLSVSYFAQGYEEEEADARSHLMTNIISRLYFDDLRTDKQLGYVVAARREKIGTTAGISFIVQSPTASTKTIMEHNQRFIQETFARLNAMSEEEFAKYRSSLVEMLQHKPESLNEEFSRFSSDFKRGNDKFDLNPRYIQQVQALTKQDIITFYKQLLIEQRGLVFISQAIGSKQEINQPAILEGFENVESIEKLQTQFEIKRYTR